MTMRTTLCLTLLLGACGSPKVERDPARLLADPALLAQPEKLALASARTSPVFIAKEGEWQFNLHSYLAYHDGKFWAMWSSGRVDEDSPNQLIRYATSSDGHQWSESQVQVDDPDGPDGPGSWIARGIYVHQGKLTALNAYREVTRETERGRESWPNLRLVRFEWDGQKWADRGTEVDNCMNNYPPRVLRGRLFMTCRDSYMDMFTALAASETGGPWTVTKLPGEEPHDRMSEPSWYVDPDDVAHLIFRDARRSKSLYRSLSRDGGQTWTAPVRTNYPDATSKNIGGRLSNGWYYLINNPNQEGRDPLAISFSRDGWTFERPIALRANAPEQRYPGRAKNKKSFQYPHAIEQGGSLWVLYSTNKEDIEISEFRIADFGLEKLQ